MSKELIYVLSKERECLLAKIDVIDTLIAKLGEQQTLTINTVYVRTSSKNTLIGIELQNTIYSILLKYDTDVRISVIQKDIRSLKEFVDTSTIRHMLKYMAKKNIIKITKIGLRLDTYKLIS